MGRAPRPFFAWIASAALAIGVLMTLSVGCTSPTLPLPPPTAPSISVGTEPRTWNLRSTAGAQPNALIIAVNRNETLPRSERVTGTIADEQGSWELVIVGQTGDFIDVSQESGGASSAPTTVELR